MSIISETVYVDKLSHIPLNDTNVTLKTYCGDKIDLLGEIQVKLEYGNQSFSVPLIVTKGNNPSLLGRKWLNKIKLDWGSIFNVNTCNTEVKDSNPKLDALIKKYNKVFDDKPGTIREFQAKI